MQLVSEGDSILTQALGFPAGSEVKASPRNAGDLGSIPGSGRSPGERNGNPLQYSCLENPMDGGAWWATALGVARSRTSLSDPKAHALYASRLLALRWDEGKVLGNEHLGERGGGWGGGAPSPNLLLPSPSVS